MARCLVITRGFERKAERRAHHANHQQHGQRRDRKNQVIEKTVVVEVDAEQAAAAGDLQSVFTAGPIAELIGEEILQLRERQRDHGEIDAGGANRNAADEQGTHGAYATATAAAATSGTCAFAMRIVTT